jgi:hypothetical protein
MLASVYGAFFFQKYRKTLPMEMEDFKPFLIWGLKAQWIYLAIAAVAEIFAGLGFGFIVLLFAVVPLCFKNPNVGTPIDPKKLKREAEEENEQWLAALGANPLDRAKAIEATFEQKSRTITASLFERWSDQSFQEGTPDVIHFIHFTVARSLAGMDFGQREALRFAEHLNSLANGQDLTYLRWRAALVWGDGAGKSQGAEWQALNGQDPIKDYMARKGLSVASVINAIAMHANEVKDDLKQPETLRAVCQEAFHAIGGAAA